MNAPPPEHPRRLGSPLEARPVQEDLTVVIPTLGRSILETCLYYLVTGSMWPGAVIVVDQGREEPVIRMIERLRAIGVNALLIPSHQSGRAAGLNRGLERVDTRFVAITDDDCFVANDWLETMSDRLHRTPARIITGRVDLAGDEDATFCVVTDREERLYTKPQLKAHPFIGGNVGMAMDLVDRIGFFDEHPCLASAEDSDYGYRALKLGIPIAYDPDVVLFHYHWRDAAQRTARYGDYARSQGGFYGTHLLSGDPLIVVQTLRALVRNPLRWLRGILARDGDLASNGRASTLNFLPGVVSGLMRRRKDLPGPKGDHGEGRNPAD